MGTMRPNKYDVVIAGALCNTNQVYLYSKCASRFVGLTPDGRVLANDNSGSGRQTVTISNHVPQGLLTGPLKLTLFIEEAQMYVCFTKRWRLVTSKKLQEYCYFYETLENGWFQYRSAVDETKHIGFTKNGKPVRYLNRARSVRDTQCFNLQKVDPRDTDDHESPKRHHHAHHHVSSSTTQRQQQEQQQQPQISPQSSQNQQQQQQHQIRHHQHHQHQQQQEQQQQQSTPASTRKKPVDTSNKIDKNKLYQKKQHAIRKQNLNNSRRYLLAAKNSEQQKRAMDADTRIKELELQRFLDYANDDYPRTSEYSNITKKPLVSKKVTSINSGIVPKFRHSHGKNHRKKSSFT